MKTDTVEFDGFDGKFITETLTEKKRVNNLMDEKPIIKKLLNDLNKNDVLYDIGANIGIYTVFSCNILESQNVYAFEPHPNNFERLKDNINLNDYDARPLKLALYDDNCIMNLEIPSEDVGEGKSHITQNKGVKVKAVKGDSLDIKSPTVIKMDVEGAELRVLKGLKHKLQYCRLMYIETHPAKMHEWYDDTVDDIKNLFIKHNFAMSKIFDRGGEKFYEVRKV